MPQVHRLGDPNDEDGIITDIPQGTVFANELLVSIDGSLVEGGPTVTANGSPTVFINGIAVNRLGDEDSDGTPRAQGSPNVYVNDGNSTGKATPAPGAAGGTGSASGADGATTGPGTEEPVEPSNPGSGNADGFKSISPAALTTVGANSAQTAMTALENTGAIPAVERLPFGADDASSSAVATRSMETASTDVANISDTTIATIEAWYSQKVFKTMKDVGALPPVSSKLPFGGDDANG